MNKVMALAGFLALSLSPSFIDWQQEANNGKRGQIVIYYVVALALIYGGLWGYNEQK